LSVDIVPLMSPSRGAVVEAHVPLVGLGGAGVALALVQDVAQLFERTGGGRVEGGGLPEIARGEVEVAPIGAPLVGFGPPQIGEHGVGPQGNRAAVGFDGRIRLILAESLVAPRQQRPILALMGGRLVGHGRAAADQRQKCQDEDRPFHGGSILPACSERASVVA
jgi:hypothetical protein